VYVLLKILAGLPEGFLYALSRFFYLIVFYLVQYRRKVVYHQLSFAFPHLGETEKKNIIKKFYRHFCELFVEVIMLQCMTKEKIKQKVQFTSSAQQLLTELPEKHQYVIAVLGHCGNWEWVNAAYGAYFKTPLIGVYHPLSNKKMDAWMYQIRSKFGTIPVPMKELLRFIRQNEGKKFIIGLIADQSAPPEHSYCMEFLNKKTTVFKGPEKLAKKLNAPVVYFNVSKTSRGHYLVDAELTSENPASEPDHTVTYKHLKALEKNIYSQPHCWLWTHRRWKHSCE
jgi:KDO2-lipid IV(A) lauroyltransferase